MTMSTTAHELESSHLHPAVLLASTRLTPEDTPEVRQLLLRVDDPADYFPTGQNLGVQVPGPHPFGNKTHHRYYTIASARDTEDGAELELLVRRCSYTDEISGEEMPGVASNFLCDAKPGAPILLTGPYRSPFVAPIDRGSNLLMLGVGTGIAPFRALLRRIYEQDKTWQGKVRLFYGARTGTEMLYMNEVNNDLANYYDQATFQAIQAVSQGYFSDESDALQQGVEAHASEILALIQDPKTYVYLAGLEKIAVAFDAAMTRAAGSIEAWQSLKQQLVSDRRWAELTYA